MAVVRQGDVPCETKFLFALQVREGDLADGSLQMTSDDVHELRVFPFLDDPSKVELRSNFNGKTYKVSVEARLTDSEVDFGARPRRKRVDYFLRGLRDLFDDFKVKRDDKLMISSVLDIEDQFVFKVCHAYFLTSEEKESAEKCFASLLSGLARARNLSDPSTCSLAEETLNSLSDALLGKTMIC